MATPDLGVLTGRIYGTAQGAIRRGLITRLTGGADREDWTSWAARQTGAVRRWVADLLAAAGRRVVAVLARLLPPRWRGEVMRRVDSAHLRAAAQVVTAYRRAVVAGSTDVRSRAAAVRRTLNRLLAAGVTAFVDRTGRRWSIAAYLAMVAATAQTAAEVERVMRSGVRRARVAGGPGECERYCRPWIGRVIQLGGTGPRTLYAARRAGLFHPNCRCRLVPS